VRGIRRGLLLGLLAGWIGAGCAARAPAGTVRTIGAIRVLAGEGRAEVPGEVCLDRGILDYLAVARESGKEYESLLVLDCRPSELHAALLALGARPGSIPPAFKAGRRGDPLGPDGRPRKDRRPRGDRIRVAVRRGGAAAWTPIEEWLLDRRTRRPPQRLEWVFTGSTFVRTDDGAERYLADVYRTVAAVWYDGVAPLNLAAAAGSPYRGENLGYEVHTRRVPPVGTRVLVAFRVVNDRSD